MTEYWVSQAKHYCKHCNCWIADNKLSKQHHEGGVKHKQAVEAFEKKKRDEKFHGARSQWELNAQLAEIEKAANDAITQDRADGVTALFGATTSRQPPPPPLIRRDGTGARRTKEDDEDELRENK
jgi:WW domain-binding protein 4